jgi:hypothetical protein
MPWLRTNQTYREAFRPNEVLNAEFRFSDRGLAIMISSSSNATRHAEGESIRPDSLPLF